MPKFVLRAVLGRTHFTLYATRRTLHGASRLVQAMSAWLVKTRRPPSRHSRDERVCGHTTTAMHKLSTPPPPPVLLTPKKRPDRQQFDSLPDLRAYNRSGEERQAQGRAGQARIRQDRTALAHRTKGDTSIARSTRWLKWVLRLLSSMRARRGAVCTCAGFGGHHSNRRRRVQL